jgi:RimJ/RimL family protein N-acetyltransferase
LSTTRVVLTVSPREVRERAGAWLAAHPYTANIPASVLADLADDAGDVLWALAYADDGLVVGVAMHGPGRPAYVPDVPDHVAEAFATAFLDSGRRPPGVLGDSSASRAFARSWAQLTGVVVSPSRRETLYVLGTLTPPVAVPGSPRAATPADIDLVAAWFAAFVVEVFPSAPDPIPRTEIEARLAAGRIVLWTDPGGTAVAMSGYRPPAAGVGRVGPVYTPPEHRGHGYAAAATAAATRAVLDREAMLFTDADNLTSNGVYRRIGYRPRGEITRWSATGA